MQTKKYQEEADMDQKNKTDSNAPIMEIEIQGHKVTLCFAEKADPELAVRIKQALIGTYLQSEK